MKRTWKKPEEKHKKAEKEIVSIVRRAIAE
jgi:hypothetical protein